MMAIVVGKDLGNQILLLLAFGPTQVAIACGPKQRALAGEKRWRCARLVDCLCIGDAAGRCEDACTTGSSEIGATVALELLSQIPCTRNKPNGHVLLVSSRTWCVRGERRRKRAWAKGQNIRGGWWGICRRSRGVPVLFCCSWMVFAKARYGNARDEQIESKGFVGVRVCVWFIGAWSWMGTGGWEGRRDGGQSV